MGPAGGTEPEPSVETLLLVRLRLLPSKLTGRKSRRSGDGLGWFRGVQVWGRSLKEPPPLSLALCAMSSVLDHLAAEQKYLGTV